MARYPLAIWSPLPGIGSYRDGPFKIVHHTTQGKTASGAIATYKETRNYPHFTVEEDAVYQHVDTNIAVTALEHPQGTTETNRSHAIQIELVGFAERPKSQVSLKTIAALCRWLEKQHGVPPVWPNGFPYPAVNGREPDEQFNRDETNWRTKGGHYGHCHVPYNHHWDPGYTADEVGLVMSGAATAVVSEARLMVETEAMPPMRADAASVPDVSEDPKPTEYVAALLKIALGEYDAYHTISETDEPLRSRIDAYCRGIGIVPPTDVSTFPWSATFVSWCIKKAGARAQEFTFSATHAVFVRSAIANADERIGVFRARPIDGYAPRLGDLIHRNRSGGTITYSEARISSDYPSHSAIVVEVGEDRIGRYAITVGGNEQDSIRKTRVALDASGRVVQKNSNPFICVVQNLKVDVSTDAVDSIAAFAASQSQRSAMAQIIVDFEARRDARGGLAVYPLPPGDGGGRYEVAGINERYHKQLCDELVALIKIGRQDEAERSAVAFIAEYTDVAASWTSNPAIEFYLRDCVFNRGSGGAAWILQRAVGVETDQVVGSHTLTAVARDEARPLELLGKLRQSREAYERLRRNESSRFWRGLVNRWDNALAAAETFLPSGASVAGGSPGVGGTSLPRDGDASQFEPPPSGAGATGLAGERVVGPKDGGAERVSSGSMRSDEFDAPDIKTASVLAATESRQPAVAAAVVLRRPGAIGTDLAQMHQELENLLFTRRTPTAFAATADAPPSPEEMIVGVGIGAAQRDFESIGAAGPGAPVLNVYVSEMMSMEAVKKVLVDRFGMNKLVSDLRPVNVHHAGLIHALALTHRERPSPCGISVGHYKITAGTQGVLARGLTQDRQRRLLMLSNNHVLANENDCQAGDAIHQPGPLDLSPPTDDTLVGVLERWVSLDFSSPGTNYVDCATAWCWPDRVRKDFIRANAGLWSYFNVGSAPLEAQSDMRVGKTGRTTQLTSGRIVDVNASLTVAYGGGKSANFRDQITIVGDSGNSFSQGGDSGSLIWTWNEARAPVGLLFAGGRDYTFANKIGHVLEALEIELFA
jgi:hypothetical protein